MIGNQFQCCSNAQKSEKLFADYYFLSTFAPRTLSYNNRINKKNYLC